MKYFLYFPYPIKHQGLFSLRYDFITECKNLINNETYIFSKEKPDAEHIYTYLGLVKKNAYSKEYLGELLVDQNNWKWVATMYDFHNIYCGLEHLLENEIKRAFFMTNTGGHHANNQRYELFSPLNLLFFMVEYLNYFDNFPNIAWIDIDAHFGNGDKELFDSYVKKMGTESINLHGFSFHNDSGDIDDPFYKGVYYPVDIRDEDFLSLQNKNVKFKILPKYILLFFGTDIFRADYGDNLSLSTSLITRIIDIYEDLAIQNNASLIVVQTGGTLKQNYQLLIEDLSKRA